MKNQNFHVHQMKLSRVSSFAGVTASLILLLASLQPARSHAGLLPGNSHAFGQTLAQWQELYWRWYYGTLTLPTDRNGNAVVGNVVLMPLPAAPGDGTPGHLDVTLSSGQAWVLPLWGLVGTSYTDGTPPDTFTDVSIFQTLDISMQIDGRTVINPSNVMDYFSQTAFDPPAPFDSPPISALIWLQDIAFVHTPLSVGTHTLKLDVINTQPVPPNFGGGFSEYHNTWTVTVKHGK
jgi:hypothetical protein